MKKKIKLTIITFFLVLLKVNAAGNIENTDYLQILIYGQSLGMGWEAPYAITTEAVEGNYMLGDNTLMRGWLSAPTTLNPLVATTWDNGGEQPIVSCVNVFSDLYRANVNTNQKFIGMTGGEGGQTIEKLSKECSPNFYYTSSFLKILNATINLLPDEETVSCPAIIFMQGEYNCNNSAWYTNMGLKPNTNGTTDKDEYKRLLLQLKNNMQQDIMTIYGQSLKPFFFIYQTSGTYIKNKDMPIAMAQYEFAQENDDVVMLNPHYALPDYWGGHLSTNGYRWFGEMTGKIIYDVLVEGETYSPVHPENFTVDGKTLTIDFYVPSPPLIFDEWTNKKTTDYGFYLYKNDARVSIQKVEIKDGDKVLITANQDLSEGIIEVVYAGNYNSGTGNLCDSYNHLSKYTYYDDSADAKKESYTPTDKNGNKIYGKNYPMQNWSVGFYHNLNSEESAVPSIKEKNPILIYPNPTTGLFNIYKKENDLEVAVFNAMGELLIKTKDNQVDITSFPSGIYFLKIEDNQYKIIKK